MAQASRKTDKKLTDTILRQVTYGLRESAFLILVGVAAFISLSLLSFHPADPAWTHTGQNATAQNHGGVVGALFADISFYFIGRMAYLVPLALVFAAWRLTSLASLLALDTEVILFRLLGVVVTFGAGCGMASLYLPAISELASAGGVFGSFISNGLTIAFGAFGGSVFLLVLLLAGFTLATGLSWVGVLELVGKLVLSVFELLQGIFSNLTGKIQLADFKRARSNEDAKHSDSSLPPEEEVADSKTRKSRKKARLEPTVSAIEPTPISSKLAPTLQIREPAQTPAATPTNSTPQAPESGALKYEALESEALESEALESGTPESEVLVSERLHPAQLDPEIPPYLRAAIDSPTKTTPVAPTAQITPVAKPPPVAKIHAIAQAAPVAKATPKSLLPDKLAAIFSAQPPNDPVPPLDLFDPVLHDEKGYSREELETMSRQVEKLLNDFGVAVNVVAVEPGPVITRFEIDPAPGVKVSQISNLAKDLARGLSVISVRVVEVIPGKSFIGLEIPNQNRKIVYLSEILDSLPYRNLSSPLTLALGKDIGGRPIVANLAKMPHLLVAGTTGSGKSVAVNAMLLSMLYKASPQEVRLILIDPKMLELSVYEHIPHLLAPVVTDMKEAANALRWCVAEMERRYKLMAALKVRNITGYNRAVSAAIKAGEPIPDPLHKIDPDSEMFAPTPGLEPLPFIVVVIDELADMMMIVGKKVEELIARLAQKARASGIHLILATQRPSVDVITGLIKANVPTRIAFQVSSKVDSRTILDQMGAEALLGHGDMLYLPPGTGFPQRVHGAFVDDHEVVKVVEYLKQTAAPDYAEDILEEPVEAPPGMAAMFGLEEGGSNDIDPLYDQAIRIVTETRKASISGVQRRLKIGYNRAARMIEEMESSGIVGPLQSNGNREVLAPPPPEL